MRVTELFRKPPVTIPADATLADAAALMDGEVVGAVVVVDDDRPVGIVTDRDIVLRGVAHRLPPDARIDAVMSTDLVTLPADADIAEAMVVFETHPFRRLPLLEDGRMVGMITVDDLVVDAVADFTRLLRPVLGQVLFGHPEPKALVPGR
jgi:CBS domain-containing protein